MIRKGIVFLIVFTLSCNLMFSNDAVSRAEEIIAAKSSQTMYSWVFNTMLSAQKNVIVNFISGWKFFFQTTPSLMGDGAMALINGGIQGGLMSIGESAAKEIGFDLLKQVVLHPAHVAEMIAMRNLDIGYSAYRENYYIYTRHIEADHSLNDDEAKTFIENQYKILLWLHGKELWNGVQKYEKDHSIVTDNQSVQLALNNLDLLSESIGKNVDLILVVDRINKIVDESNAGLLSYPPYRLYEERIISLFEMMKRDIVWKDDFYSYIVDFLMGDDFKDYELIYNSIYQTGSMLNALLKRDSIDDVYKIVSGIEVELTISYVNDSN